MFEFTDDMPISIRQMFSARCYENKFGDSTILIKLNGEWTYIVPLSEYSCNILHLKDNPNCIENAYEAEYVEDINTDKRFNNLYLDYYGEHTIFLNIIFNKTFFTVGDIYSIHNHLYELLEFSEDKLVVKSLEHDGVKDVHINALNSYLAENTFSYGRKQQTEIERTRWWYQFFNTICKVKKLDSFTETKNLIDRDLADKSILYTYSASNKEQMQLVYISKLYSEGNKLGIVNIQNNETNCISYDEAVSCMKPVVSLNKNKLKYDNISPIEFESGKIFTKLRDVILTYESNKKIHSAIFDYIDYDLFIVSDDEKIYPDMVKEAYKVIRCHSKFDDDIFYKLRKTLKMMEESQCVKDE